MELIGVSILINVWGALWIFKFAAAQLVQLDVGGLVTDTIESTIVMPCLNEAETLAICIGKARGYLRALGVAGEV